MITLNFDEVLERTYNAKKGVEVRYGLGQGFEYCKQFADEAQGYAADAKASEEKASQTVAGIEQTKTDAVQAVQNAQSTATNAVQQAQTTATDAVATKQAEAVQAVSTAQTGAVKAVDDERDAALQQVANSTKAAQTAATNAAASEQAAQASKEAAATSAEDAASSATAASGSASAAATSESNANQSAENSEASAARSEAAAQKAEATVGADKTLTISGAPADAKAVGDIILDRTKETPEAIFYSKAEVDKLLEDCQEAAKKAALLAANPVGKLWCSDDQTSPASIVGGTWERIKDTFILAAGDTYAAGSTGGEAEVTLTLLQIPQHTHNVAVSKSTEGYYTTGESDLLGTASAESNTKYWPRVIGTAGSGNAHNNMPPYTTMYAWKRIA